MTLFLFIGENNNADQANAELTINIFLLERLPWNHCRHAKLTFGHSSPMCLQQLSPLFTISFQCLKFFFLEKKSFTCCAKKTAHGDVNIAAQWCQAGPWGILIFKSWQVCDWLGKWLIMLGFMDLRQLRVAQHSKVGLVYCLGHTGFPRTRENVKRPWIWNFVPGREKAQNFGLELWKLTCVWEIDFTSFVTQIKLLWLTHKR